MIERGEQHVGKMIDVREYPEFASGHIAGATLVPLGTLGAASASWDKGESLMMVCKSGKRAELGRQLLADKGFTSVAVLDGGMDAWRTAKKPVVIAERTPWSMERQVRTVAGSLVVVTLGLGYFVSPWFLLGTGFVGAGLIFAGVSDTCMMGSMLAKLPWNRASQSTA
jgi:rhodanese-related sulfurtransferase